MGKVDMYLVVSSSLVRVVREPAHDDVCERVMKVVR